ncbi:Lrp/AsnC family transcriptional regulator [Pseudodesulfovibrio sp.]|uniref:Lrp/AsnC family transcriptional regulator n=1 Tax=Pseudodesulfovibrio sp. TaxID=2035812 RepID=UPI0026224D68|nr:Lrp/AsnC family transcriptional regulator [Pseudodesulfovibrio sp.]MDD3311678.1 Lrp/AsnC family transcriptional regulator [Pseudodesulfovibrio sp.]
MKKMLDGNDRRLISALSGDGQLSPAKIAEDMGVTAPTVRSRMKNLIRSGVLKIAGLVDPMLTRGLTVALVGISVHSHEQLGEKLDQIGALPRVNWCAVVTGRYDIIVEIVCSEDIGDLYDFLDQDLSGVGGINSSESFVVMKSRRKWLCLPDAVVESFNSQP